MYVLLVRHLKCEHNHRLMQFLKLECAPLVGCSGIIGGTQWKMQIFISRTLLKALHIIKVHRQTKGAFTSNALHIFVTQLVDFTLLGTASRELPLPALLLADHFESTMAGHANKTAI